MGKTLKRGFSVFLVLLMVFSSIPLTESFAQKITDFSVSELFAFNAHATDMVTEVSNDPVVYLQETSTISLDDSVDYIDGCNDEELKRSDINYMSNGISTFSLKSPTRNSSNPNTYTVLLLDNESAHDMYSGDEYLCTLGSPVEQVKAAALKLIEQIRLTRGTTNVAIVTVNSSVNVVQNFTSDYSVMRSSINRITTGGTHVNITAALKKADELLSGISDTSVDKNIVVFSQGVIWAGDYTEDGPYSIDDCGWKLRNTEKYAYMFANAAYNLATSLKNKYNIYTVGLYQNFNGLPNSAQDLLGFAKSVSSDIQNKGHYDITNIDDLEFSFAQDVFNLGVAIDVNKIDTTFYVCTKNLRNGTDLVAGADVFLYLGDERIKKFKTDSNGRYTLNYLTATNNGKYDINNLYVSAEYQTDDYILYSEHTNDPKIALNSIIGIPSYVITLDKYCKKYNLTVAYQSGFREQAEQLMDEFRGSFWNMTEGKCVIGGIRYNEYASEQDFGKKDDIWFKQFAVVGANKKHIYLGFTTGTDNSSEVKKYNSQGILSGPMIAHEAGHYFFGFRDEYCYGKGYDRNGVDNAGYWTPDAYGCQRTNGLARPSNSPSSFGIMESDYRSTRLSTSADYSYLNNIDGVDYSEVSKKHPEFYTRQYFDNKKSCSDMLNDIMSGYMSDSDYSVVSHSAILSSEYYDVNLYLPDSEETFVTVDSTESIIGNEELYLSSIETKDKLVDVYTDVVDDKITLTVNSDSSETYLFVESSNTPNNINEVSLNFVDGVACFELDYDIDTEYIITFIQSNESNQYVKNTYSVSRFSQEMSDDTWYSEYADLSADISSANESNDELLIIKNNNLYENGDFTSIGGAYEIIKTNKDLDVNGNIIKTLSLNSNLNLETIGVFKYENGQYNRVSQGYNTGEKMSAYVTFPYEGDGTYIIMAEHPSVDNIIPISNLFAKESSEISGLYTISFEDNNDEEYLSGYNIYYSTNPIIDLNSRDVNFITISPYAKSYDINLKDNYGKWYFAIETLAKNGSKSPLSETIEVLYNPLDSDKDGIPDYWIDKYNLSNNSNVTKADTDDDGLDNLTEYEYDTNPLNPDTDGDNVYDKIELLKGLDPLNPTTDGKTDDYIVAYGTPDLEICEVAFDEDFIYFSVKNDTDGKAMRSLVEVTVGEETIAMWSVNIDERSIVQFALDRTAVEDWNGLTIEVDSGKLVRDSDYSNNTFTYSAATGISLADMDVVKGTKQQATIDTTPVESNEIYSWKLVEGNCISIDESSGEITANKIGKAHISVETLSGLTDECMVSVVAFEGAEYSEFDSKLINNNTEVAIIGYIGDDSSIIIPETIGSLPVTQLVSNAFKGCSFNEVTIHSGINSIANTAFSDTVSLEKIVVDEANTSYCSVDGILYSLDKTQLIKYPSAKTDTIFAIPETVTSIGAYSINDCDYIEEITISESVASIGSSAINYCRNLKTVNYNAVSSSAPTGFLGMYTTFYGSNAIEKVIVGDNVTVIPQYLFFGKNSLAEVVITENSKLSTIAQCAFYNCSKLANIFIPETVKTIGSSAFYGCSKLNGVVLPEALISIGSSAFSGCSSLTSIKIPETVTSISDNTFANCTALEKVEIPYQITTIGETPFKGCSKAVIWCHNNSVAYEYAKANSIKYKVMEFDADDLVVTGLQDTFIDGLQYQLSAEIAPIYTDEKIVWSSSDSNVFTVSNSGLITAKGAGEAILTVASSRGSVSKTFNINVLGLSKDSENANLYHVRNADDMLTLSTMVNNGVSFAGKTIQLDSDIDFSNIAWTPIGIDSTNVFSGVFDGNNHKISGLNYATTSNTYSGLFGYIKTGGIKDLTVEGSVGGISRVGMIAGCIFDSALYNCKVIGEVKRIGSGSYGYVGGLVGSALHSVIINCAAETDITTDFGDSSINYAAVGGIVGAASTAGSDPMCILNSYCIGDISVSGNSYAYENYYVGGIAGYLKDDAANNYYFGEITNADGDTIKRIGYAFGYVVPEYTSESDYNGIGTIIVQDNYYLEGKNAIGLISEGDYDSSNWVSPISEENFSKLIGKGSLVDELNGNKSAVEEIIVAHRDILSNSTWAELVDRINGDSFTVSSWKIGSNNLPVNYECDCYRHAESEWIIDVEATCTKEGSKHTYCLVCQETVTTSIIEKAEHKFSDWTETKAATCTEKGSEYRTCTTCNSATETRGIAELGHNFVGEWTTDKAPTCTKSGVESRICTRCKSEKETRTVDKLGHDFESKWTVDKEATCSKVGSKSHHCSRCDEKSDVTVVNKIAHTYRESVQEATCTKDGKKTYNCSACGDSYSEVITAKGHIDQNGDGKCDNCDYIYDNTCDHMCHKSGFMGFIWKIVRFFWKLFKMNPVCECGVSHY